VAATPQPKEVSPKKLTKGKGLELAGFEKGCVVANRATKKYHLPGGRYYESGKKSKNAVFFRTEEDAKKAGYTAAKR
jgi:micrococcal nuclease